MNTNSLIFAIAFVLSAHQAPAAVHYVDVSSTNPVSPYTSWATAATAIQDAVDVAQPGALVLVTNGVYQTGNREATDIPNRVVITNAITLRSVNGPAVTAIRGNILPGPSPMRCVYLGREAVLSGFTLTNGVYMPGLGPSVLNMGGGGVYCPSPSAIVSNCVLTSNKASGDGGGANGGTLIDCTLEGNQGGGAAHSTLIRCRIINNGDSSTPQGGGAFDCTLNNCTIVGNRLTAQNSTGGGASRCVLFNCTVISNSAAGSGGGTSICTQYNSVVYFNSAQRDPNYTLPFRPENLVALVNCCTTPLPPSGPGNFTNAPLFAGETTGNLHLQPNSPCINAGNNAYVTNLVDLDGAPRISVGTVDIGAFEFQDPASQIANIWLQQHGLATDGSADAADPDRDGMSNWKEWRCGTEPLDALSALRILQITNAATGTQVMWQSVPSRSYSLERAASPSPELFSAIATNLIGQSGSTSFSDPSATNAGPYFYRVGVE